MQVKLEWKWEPLDDNTARAKVIGGWLIQSFITSNKGNVGNAMVFLADRDHTWVIRPPMIDEKIERNELAKEFS